MHLPGALEISLREFEVLTHHAELDPLRAQDVPDLAKHFVDANVGAHVAGAVISRKEQLQFFAWPPGLASAQHPSGFRALDVAADPRFQHEVHHAAVPPRAAGQGS